ncbi:sodium/potassium/calcium exchanger 1 [Sander lucioperca]|uniref:sodium/potassium/calcium exchanger 1 n=1 Tax=Sander lucioperca TaxID=283035 RepID=UPI00125E902A|nr:sodium/potassium/calcium exchanger 1 [Sander lucioperca]XP_031154304.1 sodium/potassium/calcium exchanger 1 [Sander lucioperca]XP_035849536.1 sodium/potassium/calcium exchanger 1 [Sander lucioperca]XP_035849537.1 sodium/potassium/calcium exchanger 1 [Sander lucioperca]
MTDPENTGMAPSNQTVLILFFCLIGLISLLIFLYKKLNREANGEYTVRRLVYKEGGIRDRVRGTALALGTRFGVQLWPQSDSGEDEEEMQEVRFEAVQSDEGGSQGSYSEGDDQEEEEKSGKGGDTSDDNSSLEGSEAGGQARPTDQEEAKGDTEEKVGDEEGKGEASGGAGLLIDLKPFSGSAIWSEEEGGEGKDSDMTAL